MAIGFNDGVIRLFDIKAKKKKDRVDSTHRGSWDALIYCPKRKIFIAGVAKGIVKMWSYEDNKI